MPWNSTLFDAQGLVKDSRVSPRSIQFQAAAANSNLFDGRLEVPLPADGVGINFAGDCTIEMWIAPSATPADNSDSPVTEGTGYDVAGNIILDRDIAFQSTGHILGISSGIFYFTVDTGVGQATRVGNVSNDLRDGNWHHVAVCRNATSGLIELFVDGTREDTATGPTGSIAHPDDLTHSTACGATADQDCVNSDPYLVLGCEKHELQANGYIGLLSCLRISDNIRYSGATYTVPSGPFSNDANTLGLYQMREGGGTTIADESGNNQTMTLLTDGNSQPVWSTSSPFA